jgi:ABC-type glycerol-3-phosphate transport system substrate-binding protein
MKPNFQLVIVIVFIFLAIFGILVFSGAIPIGGESEGSLGTVVLWGTVPQGVISEALAHFNDANRQYVVQYVQKSPASFDRELLEALAAGRGPDLFFLPDNLVYQYSDKIFTIPYTNYPISTFKNVFAAAGEVFLNPNGLYALPLSIDPLMLYYNRSILDANGVVYPPKTWNEFVEVVPKLTKKDDTNKIIKSGAALGHFSNIIHAKDIIATLFMQAGNPIIREENGRFQSALASSTGGSNLPSVLDFYTNFADPNSLVYSWNKSFVNSADMFSREDLAFYFGYASELQSLVFKNPNQNFFVTEMPQIQDAKFKLTGARVIGIAISSFSKNFNTAYLAASTMASGPFANEFAISLGVAPVRRDLLAVPPENAFSPTFYKTALYARSWLDPSPVDTNNIFETMVNAVLSNNFSVTDAISDANAKMSLLLLK